MPRDRRIVDRDRPDVRNATNEGQIAKAARKQKARRETELNDLRTVVQSPGGRGVLYRIILACGVFDDITETSAEVYRKLGRRSVGLDLRHDINEVDDKAFPKMYQEALDIELTDAVMGGVDDDEEE